MQQNNQSKKVLLKITDLKQWFPIKKTKLFQKEQLYVRANDGITLDIYEGETVGLVVESGCGKSTFGRTLLQLYPQTEGKTMYYGRTLWEMAPDYVEHTVKNIVSRKKKIRELEQKTMEVASDLEEFEPFDDGNYFALYNQNMKLEQGALPSGFDINAGFESGKLSTYTSSQATYYYFDVYNESEGKWIRGVRLASGLGRELSIFLLSLAILAPLSILGMAWGGRRILRKAFLPIREVTQMAEEIAESGDYSKRVSTEHQKDYVETSLII